MIISIDRQTGEKFLHREHLTGLATIQYALGGGRSLAFNIFISERRTHNTTLNQIKRELDKVRLYKPATFELGGISYKYSRGNLTRIGSYLTIQKDKRK